MTPRQESRVATRNGLERISTFCDPFSQASKKRRKYYLLLASTLEPLTDPQRAFQQSLYFLQFTSTVGISFVKGANPVTAVNV